MPGGVRRFALGSVLALAACASSPKPEPPKTAAAPPRGGQEALAVIREIEAEPFRDDDEAKAKNTVVMRWLTESPDITVILCTELFPMRDKETPYQGALFIQGMFAQAAYLIEHPGVSPKDEAVFTSSVTGALRAYRKLLAMRPEQRQSGWDELDAAEQKGQLSPHVRKAMQACAKK